MIVPFHNAQDVLRRCLASLVPAVEAGCEVVLVDDGSTDASLKVVDQWRGFRPVVVQGPRGGAAAARNRGLQSARGDFVAFLDSDDELAAEWHARMQELIGRSPTKLAFCGVEIRDEDDVVRIATPSPMGPAFNDACGLFLPGAYVVKRDVLDTVGPFDAEVTYGEHHELALRICEVLDESACSAVNEPLVLKHHDRSPQRVRAYAQAQLESNNYVMKKHPRAFARDRRLASTYHVVAARAAMDCRSPVRFVFHLLHAFRHTPFDGRIWRKIVRRLGTRTR